MKRIVSLFLAIIVVLSSFTAVSYAIDTGVDISITANGVAAGSYDKKITDAKVTTSNNSKFPNETISTVYICTIEDAKTVKIKSGTGALIAAPAIGYLAASGGKAITTNGFTVGSFASTNPNELTTAGFTQYDADCDAYYFIYCKLTVKIADAQNFGVLVQVKGKKADKDALKAAIDTATPDGGYYESNDRWNGKTESSNIWLLGRNADGYLCGASCL